MIELKEVDGYTCYEIPKKGHTIADDLHIKPLASNAKEINFYFRTKEECPFNRGNWIIDIHFRDGTLLCFRYPKEMKEKHFMKYIKPLIDEFKNKMH